MVLYYKMCKRLHRNLGNPPQTIEYLIVILLVPVLNSQQL